MLRTEIIKKKILFLKSIHMDHEFAEARTQKMVEKIENCGVGLQHRTRKKFQSARLPLSIWPYGGSVDWLID